MLQDLESAALVNNSNLLSTAQLLFQIILFSYKFKVALGCGQTSSQNSTYFESNGFSSGLCKATICKATTNICQVEENRNLNSKK